MGSTDCEIRRALARDADAVSRVIIGALRETNTKDYTADIIARVERSFSPDAVAELIDRRDVFVAVRSDGIVWTASLDRQSVRTMFVAPDLHGRGIGRALIQTIESLARRRKIAVLQVPATITAAAFYGKLGFQPVREEFHADERTIIMEKVLTPAGE